MTPDTGSSILEPEGFPRASTAALVAITVLIVLALAGSPPATNPNEVVRIELAVSMALYADFDLSHTIDAYGLSEDVSMRSGRVFSDKAPGLSMAAAPLIWFIDPWIPRARSTDLPAYWPLRHALTMLLVALPTIGLALLVCLSVPAADPRQKTAMLIIAALSTPLWTYGTVFFGHAPAALMVTGSWILLLGTPVSYTRPGARRSFWGGLLAGAAVATEYPTVLIVTVVLVTLILRKSPVRILVAAAAGGLVGVMPALWYHHVAFGAPWITGYSFKATTDFQEIIGQGLFGISWPSIESLWGVLASASRGVLFYCPLLLLVPHGLWLTARDRGFRAIVPIVTAGVLYTFFASGFVDWTAGWCAAARHLIPIIPLALIVSLEAARSLARTAVGAAAVAVLVSVSGVNAILTIVVTPFFPPEFSSPLSQLVVPSLRDGAAFSNLLSEGLGMATTGVAAMVGLAGITASAIASNGLARGRHRWLPAVNLTAAIILTGILVWQGTSRDLDLEILRAETLRRLGHRETADRVERSARESMVEESLRDRPNPG